MKKALKNFIFVVVATVAAVVVITTCTGVAIKKGIGNMIDKSMDSGPQSVSFTVEGANITKALISTSAIVLKGVQLCLPKGESSDDNYNSSSSCLNGICESKLEFEGPIPKSLTLHREYQGKCVQQTIADLSKYKVQVFSAKIKIDSDLAQKLRLTDIQKLKIERTKNSQFLSDGYLSVGTDTVINLHYGPLAVSADEFLFGSKLFRIKYSNRPEPAFSLPAPIMQTRSQAPALTATPIPVKASVIFNVDGKMERSLNLGDQYKFSISGAPPLAAFKGHCEGATTCEDWFFFSMRSAKTDASGKLSWTGTLPPNWNIPLTTYKLWIAFQGGQVSNQASFTIGPYAGKAAIAAVTNQSQPHLTLDGKLEAVLTQAAYVFSITGGEPGQLLSPVCEGPVQPCPAVGFIMQARITLDSEGKQKVTLPPAISSRIQPGKYNFWFSPYDSKPQSNKISLTILPDQR